MRIIIIPQEIKYLVNYSYNIATLISTVINSI